jgi:hypothetical protein
MVGLGLPRGAALAAAAYVAYVASSMRMLNPGM